MEDVKSERKRDKQTENEREERRVGVPENKRRGWSYQRYGFHFWVLFPIN